MKTLKLFDESNIEVHDIVYEQLMSQWYNCNECIKESISSYDFYDGGNFFDIGAFNGIYSYIFAPKAKQDCFVSFEPDVRFLDFLKFVLETLIIKYNNINYKLISQPVGNGENINYNLPNLGPNGEVGNPCFYGDSNADTQLKTITIDQYIENTNILPSIIKIDVEGAELNVLQGCVKTLKKYKPKIILEIHNDYLKQNFNTDPIEVINFIKSFNYKEKLNIKNTEKIIYFE